MNRCQFRRSSPKKGPICRFASPFRRETLRLRSSQLVCSLFTLLFFVQVAAGAPAKPVKRVLILNEVGASSPGLRIIDNGIMTALQDAPYHIQFYIEYMDSVLFPEAADQQKFREFYIAKYTKRKPDVILTIGPTPLEFMIDAHRQFFPGIPIVFCLRNGAHAPLDPEFTGVADTIAAAETLEAALRLVPDTEHVVVTGGVSAWDRQQEAVIREAIKPYEKRLDISYLTDLSLPDLLDRVSHLPDHTIVLMATLTQDGNGTLYVSAAESGPMLAQASNVPVFSFFDPFLNHGIVGGDLSDFDKQGRAAGSMTLKLLNGERPQDIPTVKDVTTYMFDWKALKRWGMKERDLPPGSIVVNRRPTAWELYKWYIVGGLCLLLVQTSLIIGLLWQRAVRRKADASRRESDNRLAGIVGTAMDAIIAIDEQQRIVLFNPAAEQMFCCPQQEAVGTPIERFIPERSRPKHAEHIQRFGLSGVTARLMSSRGVLWAMRANGEEFPMEASISRIESDSKKVFTVIVRDITERRRAETAVRESEQRFRLVANTAPVMIWTTGTDKLCDYVNKPWLDFTGRTLEEELASGWAEGVHSEDVDDCAKKYTEAFDNREQFEMEYRLRRHDGEYRWIFDRGVPRFNADGTFAGYIGCSIDVTERKRAEEALSTIGRRLIEAHEEERSWISRELHDDVNQRLALLAVELGRWSKEASQSNFTEHLGHAQSRITEIAKDVQALSHRLHSSKLEYLGLTTAARSFCKELSDKAKVEVQFSHSAVPSNMPKEVSLCLFRVLQEALQNAIKYSGVRLFSVDLRGTLDGIELTVSDDGRGFDGTERLSRHGLGLISMQERLQMVHGRFEVKTQPGAGTIISARVPLRKAEIRAMAG